MSAPRTNAPDRTHDDLVALLDHLPAFVAHWDAEERNVFANRASLTWFGIAPEDMLGRTLREVIGAEAYALRAEAVKAVLAGEPQRIERDLVDAAGRRRRVQLAMTPHLQHGEVVGFFALLTDITDLVASAAALRERTSELAVMRDRERIANQVGTLVSKHLYAVALELSASLQPGVLDHRARTQLAIEHIEQSLRELRVLLSAEHLGEPD